MWRLLCLGLLIGCPDKPADDPDTSEDTDVDTGIVNPLDPTLVAYWEGDPALGLGFRVGTDGAQAAVSSPFAGNNAGLAQAFDLGNPSATPAWSFSPIGAAYFGLNIVADPRGFTIGEDEWGSGAGRVSVVDNSGSMIQQIEGTQAGTYFGSGLAWTPTGISAGSVRRVGIYDSFATDEDSPTLNLTDPCDGGTIWCGAHAYLGAVAAVGDPEAGTVTCWDTTTGQQRGQAQGTGNPDPDRGFGYSVVADASRFWVSDWTGERIALLDDTCTEVGEVLTGALRRLSIDVDAGYVAAGQQVATDPGGDPNDSASYTMIISIDELQVEHIIGQDDSALPYCGRDQALSWPYLVRGCGLGYTGAGMEVWRLDGAASGPAQRFVVTSGTIPSALEWSPSIRHAGSIDLRE